MATEDTDTLSAPPHQPTPDKGRDSGSKIRVSSSGQMSRGEGNSISIDGLEPGELRNFEGAMHGHFWVTASPQGRLRAIPTYKDLPDPVDDPLMLPFWRLPTMGVETQLKMVSIEPLPDFCLPSITIQHLCGYNYTAEGYVDQAKVLQRWGFQCLRSRRGKSGVYWELWLLPCLSAAEHELKSAIEAVSKKGEAGLHKKHHLDAAVGFLCSRVSFGTLDVSVQWAAATIDY
jgi:hypothetical protein